VLGQWKLIAGLAVLAVIGGLIWYEVGVHKKAARVDQAEDRAEAAEKGRAQDMAEVVRRLDADAIQRGELLAKFASIDERFNSIKIPDPKVLVQTREVPGACPVVGVSDEFVRVFNEASAP
jgi:hypothetical protein